MKSLIGAGAALFAGAVTAQAQAQVAADPAPPLTAIDMFRHADIVVQGVMAALLAASVLVWAIWLAKLAQVMLSAVELRRGLRALEPGFSTSDGLSLRGLPAKMLLAARTERTQSEGLSRDGTVERAASEMSALEIVAQRRLQRGLAVIGTVASTAPFIGLFGTVWGIMNSFTGIAAAKSTNLAVVAPGIAEALLATGIGLVAAIPALMLYNHLSRLLAAHRVALAEVSRRIVTALSRDLDRAAAQERGLSDGRILRLAGE